MLTSGIGDEGSMTVKLQNGGGGEEKSNASDVARQSVHNGCHDPSISILHGSQERRHFIKLMFSLLP